ANLAVLVAELRKALGDPPRGSRFVRTVPRFGYAFSGQISGAVDASALRNGCWIIWNGREIALQDGDNLIGRDPGATGRLDLPIVSRRHARIIVSSEGAIVEDLGSKNGTLLGKVRIARTARLADLDELRVGSARLTVRILPAGGSTQTLGDG